MKRLFSTILLAAGILHGAVSSHSQQLPPVRLVDMPTAGTLGAKTLLLDSNLYDGGGLVQTVTFGVSGLINIGCSYGGAGIIGAGQVTWQPHVAVQARIRLIEESLHAPAVAIGFDSQGFGPYTREGGIKRFRTKSRGAYVAVSRNYRLLGDFGLHGGINYSLETDDGDEDPSFWVGLDKSLGSQMEIACEYDFATNDNEDSSMTANRGYLN
ncbi:hypothetical protein ACFL47_10625, partial [Candidatus Latescibacterota bacterium]